MNAQAFLFAHGEKLLVGLVFLICAGWFYAVVSDESTASVTELAEVLEVAEQLDRAHRQPGRPNLTETREFYDEMVARFRMQVSSMPLMAWLADHPQVEKGGQLTRNLQLYAYELPRPRVSVEDTIGTLQIAVEVPGPSRVNADEHYIKDAPAGVRWERTEGGRVVNFARQVAVLIEYREQGADAWLPVETPRSPGGIVPLGAQGSAELTFTRVEEWQGYELRARVVAAATGVTAPDGGWDLGREVLPVTRRLRMFDEIPRTYADAKPLFAAFRAGELDAVVAEQVPAGPVLATVDRELLPRDLPLDFYVGAPGEAFSLVTKASIYIALERLSGGAEPTATLVLKRLVKETDGAELGWTPSVEYRLKQGERVGQDGELLDVPWSDRKFPVDLRTPFVVGEARERIERVLYWEVRLRSVMEGDRFEKRLELDKKTKTVDEVLLRPAGDQPGPQLRLVELQRIRPPPPRRHVFPRIPEGGVDEMQQFEAAPQNFELPELVPPQPVEHQDHDLLKQLIPPQVADLVPLPYFEMPDGRVIYYYPPEREVYVEIIPGSDADGGSDAAGDDAPDERRRDDRPANDEWDEQTDRRDRRDREDRRDDRDRDDRDGDGARPDLRLGPSGL